MPTNTKKRIVAISNWLGVPLIFLLVLIAIPPIFMTTISGTLVDSDHFVHSHRGHRGTSSATVTNVLLFDNFNSPVRIVEYGGALSNTLDAMGVKSLSTGFDEFEKTHKGFSRQFLYDGNEEMGKYNVEVWVFKSNLERLNENPLSPAVQKESNLDLLKDQYIQDADGFVTKTYDGEKLLKKLPKAYGLVIDGTVIEGPCNSLWRYTVMSWIAVLVLIWSFIGFLLFLRSFPALCKPLRKKKKNLNWERGYHA
jgi:hypothetical protein